MSDDGRFPDGLPAPAEPDVTTEKTSTQPAWSFRARHRLDVLFRRIQREKLASYIRSVTLTERNGGTGVDLGWWDVDQEDDLLILPADVSTLAEHCPDLDELHLFWDSYDHEAENYYVPALTQLAGRLRCLTLANYSTNDTAQSEFLDNYIPCAKDVLEELRFSLSPFLTEPMWGGIVQHLHGLRFLSLDLPYASKGLDFSEAGLVCKDLTRFPALQEFYLGTDGWMIDDPVGELSHPTLQKLSVSPVGIFTPDVYRDLHQTVPLLKSLQVWEPGYDIYGWGESRLKPESTTELLAKCPFAKFCGIQILHRDDWVY